MIDLISNWFWPEWTVFGIISYSITGIYRMYSIFVLGFSFKAWRKKQNLAIRLATYPVLVVVFLFGFIYDIWLNWWLSIPTKDLPDKWDETITQRMKRYKENEPDSWKGKVSFYLCEKLNKYDPNHC